MNKLFVPFYLSASFPFFLAHLELFTIIRATFISLTIFWTSKPCTFPSVSSWIFCRINQEQSSEAYPRGENAMIWVHQKIRSCSEAGENLTIQAKLSPFDRDLPWIQCFCRMGRISLPLHFEMHNFVVPVFCDVNFRLLRQRIRV